MNSNIYITSTLELPPPPCSPQVLQFSPNNQYLAVGSRDNHIYMYQVSEDGRKYSRMGRCQVGVWGMRVCV